MNPGRMDNLFSFAKPVSTREAGNSKKTTYPVIFSKIPGELKFLRGSEAEQARQIHNSSEWKIMVRKSARIKGLPDGVRITDKEGAEYEAVSPKQPWPETRPRFYYFLCKKLGVRG